MSKPTIQANICEIDGGYYPGKLHSIPNVGDLIDLQSFIDQAANYPPVKHYEVVRVVHKIHDVSEKIPHTKDGYHFISIFVKPSDSELFQG
ncbi:MAG TPA: hypothetical protein VGD58_08135 [Herpetosiphonaceae bacterium]